MAIVMAKILNRTLFLRKETPFVMELPPYRMPVLRNTLLHMWDKASQYFKKIGGTILIAVVIIWALEYFPRSKENHQQEKGNLGTNATPDWHIQSQIEHSYLGIIGHAIEPVIRPLGFDWRMGICLVAGIPAKEIVVSTMGVLYETGKDNSKSRELLPEVLKSEVYFSGPRMGEKVFNRAVALSFLVFVLLYFPCIAVIATIKRESGSWRWALFTVFYTTAFAWIMAFITYNIALYFIRI
jgi:ferrous iron transport protein B